jgi:beta-glucosidase
MINPNYGRSIRRALGAALFLLAALALSRIQPGHFPESPGPAEARQLSPAAEARHAAARDVSPPLGFLSPESGDEDAQKAEQTAPAAPQTPLPKAAAAVEQTAPGPKSAPEIMASFDGLGEGFEGPQGTATFRNPSDNSLAVGPDHIVQIVNSKMAVFTKKGGKFDSTGRVLYGPVDTNNVFRGFGDAGKINNGDAVVRYDQLADRWLIVMPIFRRLPPRADNPVGAADPMPAKSGEPAHRSRPAVEGQPGPAQLLFQPPKPTPEEKAAAAAQAQARRGAAAARGAQEQKGSYAMCYAVSTSPDPLGSYYRYEFVRPLFPDYPRPAVWPDGYYVPSSTGDNIIQKHAYVAERTKMLKGEDAQEQGVVIDGVNFLNNADLDGKQLPPAGAPNIMMAAGGAQLKKILDDDGIYVWTYHVDWGDPSRTKVEGPVKIPVAPYRYLGGGQLTPCVPQPGTEQRLDTQGDKIMARLVYRRIGDRESFVAVHSVGTVAGGGGVRWYEFRLDGERKVELHQQGTYAPDGFYRWMASPAIDAEGNIGIGYSFGGTPNFAGQRFAGRLAGDPPGLLTLREAILAEGEVAQTNTLRWMDYTQTAIDPADDRTIWYVGDYLKKGATSYSTRIGAFRLAPGPSPVPPSVYYVDSRGGDDSRAGTAPETAWKTIAKINGVPSFLPGDKIFFKAGSAWTGALRPRGSGAAGRPILIAMYGAGERPLIQAGIDDVNALSLQDQSFWEISDLELTNRNPDRLNDRMRRGIYVEAKGALVEHIHLKNLRIHDVRGVLATGGDYNNGKDSAGIGFEATAAAGGVRFDDLLVDGCDLFTIDSTGIFTKGASRIYPRAPGWDAVKFTNVVLQNNKIHDIGKNAVIVRNLDGGLIQKNTVWDTAFRCQSGNQIFTRTCFGTVVQYNEGYLNRATTDQDGSAFDADLESPGTVWQYNYSHDNRYGLITLCTSAPDSGIIVRYNISRNDRGRLLNINYNFTGVSIYNNVFYIPAHLSPQIIWETHARTGDNFSGPQTYSFDNNIIYNLSPTASYNLNPNQGTRRQTTRVLRNNCFYGAPVSGDPRTQAPGANHTFNGNLTADPKLVNPGSGGSGLGTLAGYQLQASSPCRRAGSEIAENGGKDFWGNPIPAGPPDIGAHAAGGPVASIYRDGWIDLNKNGVMDPYENPKLDTERRIVDLLGRMTLEEKTCQMATLYGFGRVLKDALPTESWLTSIWKDGMANIDEHLNGLDRKETQSPYTWPPSKHAKAINDVQRFFIEKTRLGIPVDFTNEGIRGVCYEGATGFPATIGIGSTWDIDLVGKIGSITGREGRSTGYTNIYSPILDLARDPRWGRVVECYGEDPYLVSRIGVAHVRAMQAEGVAATAKHFAVYSIPKGGRDGEARTDPHVAPREVETLFLAPFRAAVREAGVLGIMSSYNDYDGVPITGSHDFLIKKLRREWGFKGYIVSDSKAVEYIYTKHRVAADPKDAVRQAVEAGLNVRTEFTPPDDFILPLRALVRDGVVAMATIDERVADVLRVKFILGLFDKPYVENPGLADRIIASEENQQVARRASRESIVLLKNEGGTLPLRKSLKSILVTGPNAAATASSISRYGPNKLKVISVLDGIKTKVGPGVEVRYAKGCELIDAGWPESEILPGPPAAAERIEIEKARDMARGADAAIVVVGEDERIVGESKSRTSLDLPGYQLDLVKAVVATGTPTVVVLVNGRPLSINWIDRNVPAVVEAWFPGPWGGTALADVLFGDYNPGGRLPVTFPKSVGQLPLDFPYKPGSDLGDKTGVTGVLYPFGHGLSYTDFRYSNLTISPQELSSHSPVTVTFDVENTGRIAGDEVVQLYTNDETSSVTTYVKNLRGFKRIPLRAGEKRSVSFTLTPDDLSLLDGTGTWVVEPGRFKVMVGRSSADIRLEGEFAVR